MATQPRRSANEIDYRITLGAYVNARLQVNPKAFRIPCNNRLDIYIVRDADKREHLFPALKEVVLEIDPAADRMVVRPQVWDE